MSHLHSRIHMQHGLRQQFVSKLKKTCTLGLQCGSACGSRGKREKHFTPLPHPLLHIASETASFSTNLLHALPHFHPRVQVFAVTQIAATISAACESESASPNSSVRLKKALMARPCLPPFPPSPFRRSCCCRHRAPPQKKDRWSDAFLPW